MFSRPPQNNTMLLYCIALLVYCLLLVLFGSSIPIPRNFIVLVKVIAIFKDPITILVTFAEEISVDTFSELFIKMQFG